MLLLTLGAVFAFVFFATMTREGQPQKLPVAVVDLDGSYLSRRLCHELDATQGVRVVALYTTHTEARQAMQQGKVFAFYEIPSGTYNAVLQFRSPRLALYTNQSYLLAGSLSYRQLVTMGKLAAGAVQREVLRKKGVDESRIMGLIQPIILDTHPVATQRATTRPT
jgi:ABC-2 type transport system permease protein